MDTVPIFGTSMVPILGIVPLHDDAKVDKNSSGDEIANVNFYAVRQKGTRIR